MTPSINAALLIRCSPEKFVEQEEGTRCRAYQDQRGVWTIGSGHTGPEVHEGLVWTESQCLAALHKDLSAAEYTVAQDVTVSLNQNEFDALTSLCFNIGRGAFASSTVLRKLNAGDREGAANAFLMWNEIDHKESDSLTNRRKRERALFLEPMKVGA